ncbi:tyrosine--tRNA ligase, partial [Streptomyces scabiei]
ISDELMWRYYDLLSSLSIEEIAVLKEKVAQGTNPRDIKIDLAKELIARFHSDDAAQGAHEDFIKRFQKNALPDDIPDVTV